MIIQKTTLFKTLSTTILDKSNLTSIYQYQIGIKIQL